MKKAKILIVEDEHIIAEDLAEKLKKMGYDICDIANSGQEAIQKAVEKQPDLVLMDIMLKGEIDGISTYEQIKHRLDLGVIYLTAFSDEKTLQKAKITEPFGYILKPFKERELQVTIEMALYKHKTEKALKESEKKYRNLADELEMRVQKRTVDLAKSNEMLKNEINERQRAEGILKESEERYRKLIHQSLEAIYLYDVETRIIIETNQSFLNLLGYTAQEVQKLTLYDIVVHDRKDVDRYLQKILESGGINIGERKWKKKDGSLIDVHVTASTIKQQSRDIIFVVARDITEHKRAEMELERRNQQLEVLNSISNAISTSLNLKEIMEILAQQLVKRMNFKIAFASEYIESNKTIRMFSIYPRDSLMLKIMDMLGLDVNNITASFDGSKNKVYAQVLKGEDWIGNDMAEIAPSYLPSHLVRMGQKLYGIKSIQIIPVVIKEKFVGTIVVGSERDVISDEERSIIRSVAGQISSVIESARLFEQIRISEEKYRTLFEESKDTVYISTPEGRFVDINPAGVELFGYSSKEELLKIDIAEELYSDPLNRENLKQILSKQGYVKDFESVMKRKNGDKIIVTETATVVRDDKGSIVTYRGIIRNITEHKQAEEKMRRMEQLANLGKFSAIIAHEINNPLGAINLNFQHLERELKIPESYKRVFKNVETGISRIQDVINGILNFSRPLPPNLKKRNLHEVLDISIYSVEKQLRDANITIVKNYGNFQRDVFIDSNKIIQVFVNLFLNAKDAMSQSGKLTITTFDNEDSVTVHIQDTGSGISSENLAKIFDPFFTTKTTGVGLGLAVVYKIIEQHKAQIFVESDVGMGTKFIIKFPLAI